MLACISFVRNTVLYDFIYKASVPYCSYVEAYLPDEADFFIESATDEQLEALDDAGYDLPLWEDREIDESEEEEKIEETDES